MSIYETVVPFRMKNKLNLRDLKENTNRNPNIKQHVMLPLFNMQDTIV